ncbi:MAG: class II glutamine amidotransferase [Candidatus Marinimicrobia bacterium]|nr:class II glutamine amidotransferase [Candidatus Neomarinimicrobiota bacterium]
MKQHLYWGSDESNLKNQADYYHTDGWGMLNYLVSYGMTPSVAEVFRSNVPAATDINFIRRANDLLETFPNVSVLMAHIRRASSGAIDIPDPHPWVNEMGGVTYTFEHNGTITNKLGLKNLIGNDWINSLGGFNTFGHGSWENEGWLYVVDSEVYFFWILKNIDEAYGNVLEGLYRALADESFNGVVDYTSESVNCLLSNGSALWAYRRAQDDDSDLPFERQHTLHYKNHEDATYHYRVVASSPTAVDFHSSDWYEMADYQLVYLPREGDVIVYDDFPLTPYIEVKKLKKNWNWVGFPVMEDVEGTSVTTVLESVAPYSLEVQHESDNTEFIANIWIPPYDLNSTDGYKVLMSEEQSTYNLETAGERVYHLTPITVNEGNNWVSYFIQENQEPLDALPANVIDRLTAIKAQDWYMIKKANGGWYTKLPPNPPVEGEPWITFKYGEMYILTLSTGASIEMIYESGYGTPGGGGVVLKNSSFEVQELDDYTAFSVDAIEDPETVTEIGIFLGDDCIGAQPVIEFPVYMQAYNGDQSLDEISFQVVRDGGLAKGSGNSETDNAPRQTFREHFTLSSLEREITDGGFVVYHANLEKSSEPMITTTALLACYPNPFNPITTLRYELAKNSPVSVVVYNMQGRVVDNLYYGKQSRGQHELTWNASTLESGLYFVVFKTGCYQSTQKMMLIK